MKEVTMSFFKNASSGQVDDPSHHHIPFHFSNISDGRDGDDTSRGEPYLLAKRRTRLGRPTGTTITLSLVGV
jgi:hypothetical protein